MADSNIQMDLAQECASNNDMPERRLTDAFYRDYTKRIIDIIVSFFALCTMAIPMAVIAVIIKLDSPGPVFFLQKRIGKNGKVFSMIKFRSMCVGAEHTGSGVYSDEEDERVTRVGRILRNISIDELPQFINVLCGEMSLIGPRPPVTYHPWSYESYSEEQKRMFDVRPGLSGWAQVHGGRSTEWNHRIEMNVWYVNHVRFGLDLKIIGMTILNLLKIR